MGSRRVRLPGVDEIFRPSPPVRASAPQPRSPTGRQRHDSKITVYISSDELFALEQLRLTLRGEHGLPVDRGRLVREAVAAMINDFDAHGEHSTLVRRLRGAP
ncbi:hypothetical protein [Actinomadura sp. 3N407]|uniref:hypothetical protein n=1 Tax=Actinomadura sp. 3N407 TaxID=3457423 RepID=UPI003FCD659B